eukprot:1160903-Pelagomonas_calceolata.AAC.2
MQLVHATLWITRSATLLPMTAVSDPGICRAKSKAKFPLLCPLFSKVRKFNDPLSVAHYTHAAAGSRGAPHCSHGGGSTFASPQRAPQQTGRARAGR